MLHQKVLWFFCLILIISCNKPVDTKQNANLNLHENKTLMAIFAHPDDEIVISPVLAKYAKEGANIHVVYVTDGSKGVADHANIPAGDALAKVRAEEALCLTKTLGINPSIFLNYTDGDLATYENIYSLDDKINELFTRYQPNVVISFGPGGEYGHSDHRMVSNIVPEVFQREASSSLKQLLYYGFPKEHKDNNLVLKSKVGNWFYENWKTTQKRFLTYRIPFNNEDLELGYKASSCHKSQYTKETVDDLFSIIKLGNNTIYLRPWNGAKEVTTNIFD